MGAFYIAQMVLGLGLVIFVHELGHFMAARWCKVTVRTFSLGFGPPLASFERNGVRYQIAAVPIGGFVSMAGEYPGDEGSGPREGLLSSKTVGQRFFVYSAGVIMNLLFALVVLPILFWVGVPFTKPILGDPAPGGAAWEAGLGAGTEVLEVNGNRVIEFSQILSEVALSPAGPVELVVRDPGADASRRVTVEPFEGSEGFKVIGVGPGSATDGGVFVREGGAAARAGIDGDDRLVGVVGQPAGLSLERQLLRAENAGEDIALVVADAEGAERTVEVDLEWRSVESRRIVGVEPLRNVVEGVRRGGPFAELVAREELEGARLVEVRGVPVRDNESLVDALLAPATGADGTPLASVVVRRDGTRVEVTDALEAHVASRPDPVAAADDLALGYDVERAVVAPSPRGAAGEAGVLPGDRVVEIDGGSIESWNDLLVAVGAANDADAESIQLTVERGPLAGVEQPVRIEFTLEPRPVQVADLGLDLERPDYVYRTSDPLEAITTGIASTRKILGDVWMALQRIVTAEISSRNIGGVVSMGFIGYHTAKEGPSKLFYFLCLLSINLALINVLPIPVLDGGHLLFLLVEKLKGTPVSERVLGYSQLVGFVMIVSLVVYVTWNDLQRWVLG